jgi:integrase
VRVVADVLGPADVRTTQNVYQHVLATVQRDAADRMDALFAKRA